MWYSLGQSINSLPFRASNLKLHYHKSEHFWDDMLRWLANTHIPNSVVLSSSGSSSPQSTLLGLLDSEEGCTMLLHMSITRVLTSQQSITSQRTHSFIYTAVRLQAVIHYHDHNSQPWILFLGGWIHTHRWDIGNKMIILTLCHWVTCADMIAMPCIVNGSRISMSHTQYPIHAFLSCSYHLTCKGYQGLKFQTCRPFLTSHSSNPMISTQWRQIQIPSLLSFVTFFSTNHAFV